MHTTCYLVRARTPLSHMCVCTSHLYIMKFVVHFSTLHIPYYLQIYQVYVQRCTSHFCSLRSVFLLWTKIFTTTWESLKKTFAANTTARKLQLRQCLYQTMVVSDYNVKIRSICDLLGSINLNVDEDEMVQVCLSGLAQ